MVLNESRLVDASVTATATVQTSVSSSFLHEGNDQNENVVINHNIELVNDNEDTNDSGVKKFKLENGDESVNKNDVKDIAENNTPKLEDIPRPTDNGGYSHTTASKAKISAANKGKTPWNKGKARSEETKAKIREGVLRRVREKHLAKLAELGLTEEEWEAEQKRLKAEKAKRRTINGGYKPSKETKKKIADKLKAKWAAGEVKRKPSKKDDPSYVNPRKGVGHSEETKQKIRETLKKKWEVSFVVFIGN